MLSNPGTLFNEDGFGDVIADIRKLYLMMGGTSNDMNAASKGVDQSVSEIGFPLLTNNLSEYANNPAAITQIRNTLGIPAGLAGLFTLNGMPVGGTVVSTSYAAGTSGTHSLTAATKYCYFRLTGSGGSGGGSPSAGLAYHGGGGGGEGATIYGCIKVDGITSIAYSVGAATAGSTLSTNNGVDGASSTLAVGSTTATAMGGRGGSLGGLLAGADAGHGGYGGGAAFFVGTILVYWGKSGQPGQPGRTSQPGRPGESIIFGPTVDFGEGSGGGALGNPSDPTGGGYLTIYELT